MIYNDLGKTDMKISAYSLGGSPFGGIYGETSIEESSNVVKTALKRGVNMIDTAPWYGQGESEVVLGKILPKIERTSYFVNTKVGRYKKNVADMFDFSYYRTLKSVDESLERMNLEYFDIIQAHDIEFASDPAVIANETLPALQKIKEQGKARYIGITGYSIDALKKVVEISKVQIDTVLSYCHGTISDNSLQDHVDFFEKHGVGMINASGLSMGLLSKNGPAEWHPASQEIKEACKQATAYCKEMGSDISKLAIFFCLNQSKISSTLFGTANLNELEANLAVVENGITKQEKLLTEEVIERYFNPLECSSWEGVEVEEYWKAIQKTDCNTDFTFG